MRVFHFLFLVIIGASPALASFTSEATPADRLVVKEGFKVERLYSVPKGKLGSWITLTEDNKGRLIAGDQYGSIYRFPRPAPDQQLKPQQIEKIDLNIGHAWGLCYAFDSLYVVVNDKHHQGRGLYRLRDTTGDDKFDKIELLKKFQEVGGEHGPHAVIPSPDGKSLYIACGNQTALPEKYQASRVSEVWGEDTLQPRIYGRAFMKGAKAPLGWVCKTDPEGKNWEVIATGFRNQYDIDFNPQGELFTYDADMEWDINTPWYRPTRINHVISGAEFGWRNGSAKWPEYYSDSFGAAVNIGPGSPTGVIFGTGAKFPHKYQRAFFACDWSYGKLYAIHLKPDGSSYKGTAEEFIAGQPLPLTDIIISKADRAMYFTVGGRRVQSGLYRVTYTGKEPTTPAPIDKTNSEIRSKRLEIEKLHLQPDPSKIELIWKNLGSNDRATRFAARTALEKLPTNLWAAKTFSEKDPSTQLAATLSLARTGSKDHQKQAIDALLKHNYQSLPLQSRYDLLRSYALVFIRLAPPTDQQRTKVAQALTPSFPASTANENIELSNLLGYLNQPQFLASAISHLHNAPTQEEQIAIAKNIRLTTTGWTPELEEKYFSWFTKASTYKGGASLSKYLNYTKNDALKRLSPERKKALKPILTARPPTQAPIASNRIPKFVKDWKMNDLKPLLGVGLEGGRNFEKGREMFSAASCFACHRFNQEGGGIGPDLTSAAGKFSPHDLLESIIEPNKEISDQYGAMKFTLNDGSEIIGRIANLTGNEYRIITNLMAPGDMTHIKTKKIKSIDPWEQSMMPAKLLNTLNDGEILDLLAYILSAGDEKHPLFQK